MDTGRPYIEEGEIRTFNQSISEEELLEEKYFINTVYRKIKKRLIYEIALARIQEISEKIVFKNINYTMISFTYQSN